MFDAFLPFDGAIAQWIATTFQPGAGTFWDTLWVWITRAGDGGFLWIALGVALLLFRKTRKAGIVTLIALAFNGILTNAIIKPLLSRDRPYNIDFIAWAKDYVYPALTKSPGDKSFPSGHTAISFAGACGLFFGLRPDWLGSAKPRLWAILGIVLAALVGFSRLFLGVHYATDVLAGAVVGALCAFAAMALLRKLEPVLNRRWPKIFASKA